MSHSNISIFVPHLGCPHQCSFCNQKHITGCTELPHEKDIDEAVSIAVNSKCYDSQNTEIAFFGGSFTAIKHSYMVELLEAAYKYVKNNTVSGIRISTRPDCINSDVLKLLKGYGVTAIELGAQSMCDDVLAKNNRGHLSTDVEIASKLIKDNGFSLGLQMMTGLYTSTEEKDIYTASKLCDLKPDTVRIYPTITLKNTYLEQLYIDGKYVPMSLESAVSLAVKLEDIFVLNDINVIRVGLHSIDTTAYVAGPWHPAFRELCDSTKYRNQLSLKIHKEGIYNVYISPKDVSKIIGQKRSNIKYFEDRNITLKIIPDNTVDESNFIVEEVN